MRRGRSLRDLVYWALRLTNLSLLFAIAAGTGVLLGTYSGIAEIIPKARDLGDIRPGQASRVLSAEGQLLGQVATEHRQFVQLETIPKALQDAVVATEDQGFYNHIGVDPRAIVRAAVHDVIALGPRQGGSTITQQLARNVYLTRAKTVTRKLAELVLAVQLERAYTKPEIMELYLNQIYFGEGAYGVQVAANTYFGKDVEHLTVPECAMLAGLPKRPEHYSPFKDQQRAVERRNLVLSLMAEQGYLSPIEAKIAQKTPLRLVKEHKPLGLNAYRAPYFTNYVLREVAKKYGPDVLYRGGLTIHTTLNLEMQEAAEEAVQWGASYARGRHWNVEQLALVAVNSHTGAIKAMVGGLDYGKSEYNRAVQGGRQAGSAFKPFVYTAALEVGYTPDSKIDDTPVSYRGAMGKPWSPKNYDGKYHGHITFKRALSQSYNVATVKVAAKVGITTVIDTAERMGIYHQMDPYLPLAIGSCDVAPLEMASAYAVFATRGMRTEPFGIAKIQDATGRTVFEHKIVTWRVLNEEVADQMVGMLEEVIKSGTGAGIRRRLPFPAAGKTGTSNDYKDAWFVGFADDLSAAVWAGNDQPHPMGRVAGASLPAPMWARFMVKAQPVMTAAQEQEDRARVVEIKASDQGASEAPRPPSEPKEEKPADDQGGDEASAKTVTKRICPTSGMLAGPNCPKAVQVTYDLESGGAPPKEVCNIHTTPLEGEGETQPQVEEPTEKPQQPRDDRITLPICAISGKIATARCPLVVNRTFKADEAPTETCDRHARGTPGP